VDDLRETLTAAGVDGAVVVQADSSDDETDWLVRLAASTDLIAGIVGWVDLTSPSVGDRLAELRDRGDVVCGIRHQVFEEPDKQWLSRADVSAGLSAVSAAGLAYDLLVRRPESAAAIAAVTEHPDLVFVVDHAAVPGRGEWDAWLTDLTTLAAHENVYCKISGLEDAGAPGRSLEEYVAAVIEAFGPRRCMFGSDWPMSLRGASYETVLDRAQRAMGHLSAPERDSVFRGTATTVYQLDRDR
jgi:L-fuconolactonase